MTQSARPSPPLPPDRRMHERRPEGPRRVKNGLKPSVRDGRFARNEIAARWQELIEAHVVPEVSAAGAAYAQSGQIVSLHARTAEIEAHVQGTAARPYVTRLVVPALTEEQWKALIFAMAGEAIFLARMLGGEVPPGLDDVFAQHHLALLPAPAGLTSSCTCPQTAACKHVAAAGFLFADQLSLQPLLLFTVLGLEPDRLLERLRHVRTLHTQGAAGAAQLDMPGGDLQTAAPALESQIDDFWRGSGDVDAIQWEAPQNAVPHALLRRLGPSPVPGKFPLAGLLASIYDTVAEAAGRTNAAIVDGVGSRRGAFRSECSGEAGTGEEFRSHGELQNAPP